MLKVSAQHMKQRSNLLLVKMAQAATCTDMRILTNRFFAIAALSIVFVHFLFLTNKETDDGYVTGYMGFPKDSINWVYISYFILAILLIIKKVPAERKA